MAMY